MRAFERGTEKERWPTHECRCRQLCIDGRGPCWMHAYSLRAIASCTRNMSPSQQTAACVVIVRYDSSVPPCSPCRRKRWKPPTFPTKKSCGADTVTRLQARYVEFQRGLSVAVDRMAASTFILVRPSSIHNLLNFCSQFSTRKLSCNLRLQLNFPAT